MPAYDDTQARTMKAYRQDGTEVQPGDTITDSWAGHTDIFYAATRLTEPGHSGRIQVGDPFGPEYYAGGFGLTVRYADPVPVVQSACCTDPGASVADSIFVMLNPAQENAVVDALARRYPSGSPVSASTLQALHDAHNAPSADVLAAEAELAARTMAPPVPGVTEHNGYVMFTVIDGSPAGDGLLRSWYVAGQREDGACVVWTAYQRENGTLSYEAGSYVTAGQLPHSWPGEPGDARRRASMIAAKRAGVLTTLTEYVTGARDGGGLRARFDTSYSTTLAELNGTAGLARAKVRDALLEAAAFGQAPVSGSGGRTWTVSYDRMRCVFSVRQDS